MPTYAFPHYVFRVLGFFGPSNSSQVEQWSTGLRIGLEGGAPIASSGDLVTFLESVSSAIATFHGASGNRVGNNCFVRELTIARVGTDGKYDPADMETVRRPYPTPVVGTSTPSQPWNTAYVAGLRTKYPRGIAANGRMYYPQLAADITTGTGRINNAVALAYATAVKNLIAAVNTAANANLTPSAGVIVAGATGQKGPARNALVTAIRVDDRIDSIERRENDVAPHYTTVSIA